MSSPVLPYNLLETQIVQKQMGDIALITWHAYALKVYDMYKNIPSTEVSLTPARSSLF